MKATEENVKLVMYLLRIDDSEETCKVVSHYVDAAEVWLANAGVKADYGNSLYVDAVALYVGARYENPAGGETDTPTSLSLNSITEQLRLAQEDDDGNTEADA